MQPHQTSSAWGHLCLQLQVLACALLLPQVPASPRGRLCPWVKTRLVPPLPAQQQLQLSCPLLPSRPAAPSASRLAFFSTFVSMTLCTAAAGVTEGNRGPGRPGFATFLVISIASLAVRSSDAKPCKGETF